MYVHVSPRQPNICPLCTETMTDGTVRCGCSQYIIIFSFITRFHLITFLVEHLHHGPITPAPARLSNITLITCGVMNFCHIWTNTAKIGPILHGPELLRLQWGHVSLLLCLVWSDITYCNFACN